MTILESYNQFILELGKLYDIGETRTIADWIFEDLAQLPPHNRREKGSQSIDPTVAQKIKAALIDLLNNKPIQYILGEAWFYKMKFTINEHVLIPRPETEELVGWIIEGLHSTATIKIIDIGTGSGCIPVALKKIHPSFSLTAIDISGDALLVAKQNASLHHVEIDYRELDFLNETNWDTLPGFDIIISNPPYIPLTEKSTLAKNVSEYEPHLALFVKNDPTLFYKKIARFANGHLHTNGNIYVEVHEQHASEVQEVFAEYNFTSILKKDIYERDRMIKAFR